MKRKTAKRAKRKRSLTAREFFGGGAQEDWADYLDRMHGLTFGQLAQANRVRSAQAFPECADWTPSDWATALAGETGELCNFIKKRRRGERVPIETLGKELADVVTYADHIARQFNINLADAVRRKFNEVSERRKSPIRL
jgi:NTP pyrophosphatase (non-canonical NTP hydrolase)